MAQCHKLCIILGAVAHALGLLPLTELFSEAIAVWHTFALTHTLSLSLSAVHKLYLNFCLDPNISQ